MSFSYPVYIPLPLTHVSPNPPALAPFLQLMKLKGAPGTADVGTGVAT